MAQLPLDGNLEHHFWPNNEMTNSESGNTIDGEEGDENHESIGMEHCFNSSKTDVTT